MEWKERKQHVGQSAKPYHNTSKHCNHKPQLFTLHHQNIVAAMHHQVASSDHPSPATHAGVPNILLHPVLLCHLIYRFQIALKGHVRADSAIPLSLPKRHSRDQSGISIQLSTRQLEHFPLPKRYFTKPNLPTLPVLSFALATRQATPTDSWYFNQTSHQATSWLALILPRRLRVFRFLWLLTPARTFRFLPSRLLTTIIACPLWISPGSITQRLLSTMMSARSCLAGLFKAGCPCLDCKQWIAKKRQHLDDQTRVLDSYDALLRSPPGPAASQSAPKNFISRLPPEILNMIVGYVMGGIHDWSYSPPKEPLDTLVNGQQQGQPDTREKPKARRSTGFVTDPKLLHLSQTCKLFRDICHNFGAHAYLQIWAEFDEILRDDFMRLYEADRGAVITSRVKYVTPYLQLDGYLH